MTQIVPGEIIVRRNGSDDVPRRRRRAGRDHRRSRRHRHRHGRRRRRTSTKPRPRRRASARRPGCATRSPTKRSRRSTPRWPGRWRSCRSRSAADASRRMAIPARAWLASYDRTWLRADVVAGITLAAYLLPAAIGDASLAGLPPEAGLYACLFGGLVFWLFCSSRQTAVTVTSAISLLVGASLGEMAGGDPARHAALAACTALMVAGARLRGLRRRAPAPSSTSSRKPCSSASSAASRCSWRARSCRSCSASAAATAISGSAWATSSAASATPTRRRSTLGLDRPGAAAARQDRPEEPARRALRRGRRHRRRARAAPRRARRGAARRGAAGPADAGAAAGQPRRRQRARCRWRWRASSSRPSKPRRSGGCSPPSTAIGSTPRRSSWRSAAPISWPASAADFR